MTSEQKEILVKSGKEYLKNALKYYSPSDLKNSLVVVKKVKFYIASVNSDLEYGDYTIKDETEIIDKIFSK